MPSIVELRYSLDFDRVTGLHPHGHFDHEATLMTGPKCAYPDVPATDEELVADDDLSSIEFEEPEIEVRQEEFEDPWTGEPLYRTVESH